MGACICAAAPARGKRAVWYVPWVREAWTWACDLTMVLCCVVCPRRHTASRCYYRCVGVCAWSCVAASKLSPGVEPAGRSAQHQACVHQRHGVLVKPQARSAVCASRSIVQARLHTVDAVPSAGGRTTTAPRTWATVAGRDCVRLPTAWAPCAVPSCGCDLPLCCRLLVLDEVDALASGHSEVLQHLFHWAAAQHTKLLLVTISNSFDLISRALPLLQTACPQQVAFETYTVPQIAAIIQRRIASCCGNDDDRAKRVVDPGAVEFLARKVAKTSGDLRKSLSLCSRAVAVAAASNVCSCGLSRDTPMAGGSGDASAGAGASAYNGHNEVSLLQRVCESATSGAGGCRLLLDASVPSKPCSGAWKGAAVGFGEMAKVVREGTTSHVEAAIRGLPQHCQIVLYVALQQLQQSKSRLSASPLQHAYARFCKERRLPMAPSSQFSDLLSWLASSGLINVVGGFGVRLLGGGMAHARVCTFVWRAVLPDHRSWQKGARDPC